MIYPIDSDQEWTWYQSLRKISQKGHFKMESEIWHNYVLVANSKTVDQLEINGQYSEKVLPLDMKLRRTVRKEIVNQIFV